MSITAYGHWPMGEECNKDDGSRFEFFFCNDQRENEEALHTALDTIMRHGEEEISWDESELFHLLPPDL